MLFQRPKPFPMSIMDNVVAGAKAHRLADRNGLRQIAEQRLTKGAFLRVQDAPRGMRRGTGWRP